MNSKVKRYRGLILGDLPAYWFEGNGWHGIALQTSKGPHFMWAEHNPKWAKVAHERLRWNYDDLAGDWVLCAHSPEGQETMYGPRKGAEDRDIAEKMILTLLATMYEELKEAQIKATEWTETSVELEELFIELCA